MSIYYEEYSRTQTSLQNTEREIQEVKIRGTKTTGMPMWMINNYIKSTCDNYTKLVYILKIIDIFSNEASDIADIGISTESVPIGEDGRDFENKLISCVKYSKSEKDKEKYCLMSHVSEEEKKGFFHYFNSCERPVCFAITNNHEVILLCNPRGGEGVKVCDISYHSPIDIVWSGIGECMALLFNAGLQARNDQRLQKEHEARMLTQALQTIGEAARVQEKLENANLPGCQKAYLKSMYDGIMAKQEKLNEKIGIECPGVDTRA